MVALVDLFGDFRLFHRPIRDSYYATIAY